MPHLENFGLNKFCLVTDTFITSPCDIQAFYLPSNSLTLGNIVIYSDQFSHSYIQSCWLLGSERNAYYLPDMHITPLRNFSVITNCSHSMLNVSHFFSILYSYTILFRLYFFWIDILFLYLLEV